MKVFYGLLVLCWGVEGVVQNISCPEVDPVKLDLKELDGKWYISAVATDFALAGDCATFQFQHTSANTTNVSLSSVNNKTANFYNGTGEVQTYASSGNGTGELLTVTYSDNKVYSYSILGVDYEHYVVLFSCNNTDGKNGASNYELWQLSRTPHLKAPDAAKITEAVKKYNLQNTELRKFNNTEECCKTTSGSITRTASLLFTAIMSFTAIKSVF